MSVLRLETVLELLVLLALVRISELARGEWTGASSTANTKEKSIWTTVTSFEQEHQLDIVSTGVGAMVTTQPCK